MKCILFVCWYLENINVSFNNENNYQSKKFQQDNVQQIQINGNNKGEDNVSIDIKDINTNLVRLMMQMAVDLKSKKGLLFYAKSIEMVAIEAQKFDVSQGQLVKKIMQDFDELKKEEKVDRLKHMLEYSSHTLMNKLYLGFTQIGRKHILKQYLLQKIREKSQSV
eukprot:TRINITY_DN18169_c0_g1_i11.p1 TRINITY_DN18169_c0_g1~~TRINITY_DN18169_c0_g1_i11.p1  ORF type:complete len:165 (-),score=13.91 TRINITY_DN18169_c0_g1_i11:196-690(-)